MIVEAAVPLFNLINKAIIMSAIKVILKYLDYIENEKKLQNYKTFSIFSATVAETTTLKISPVKTNAILNNIASKWDTDKISPPDIETKENYFQNNVIKKS